MNADDPKFTAYLLDELDPAERAALEAELRAQPALAAELEEMRRFTAQLRSELHAEEGAPLRPEQRAAVLGEAQRIVAGPRAWWRRPWVQSAAAACVIVGAIAALLAQMELQTPGARLGLVQKQGMKLSIEPEPEKTGPGDFTAVPATAPVLADAKPQTTLPALDASSGVNLTSSQPVTLFAQARAYPQVPPRDSPMTGEGTLNISGASGTLVTNGGSGTVNISAGTLSQDALASSPPVKKATDSIQPPERGKSTSTGGRHFFQTFSPDAFDAGLSRTNAGSGLSGKAPTRGVQGETFHRRIASDGADARYGYLDQGEPEPQGNTEAYDTNADNAFCAVKDQPLSTFSIDVDTASYANVRRLLNANERPPKGAVRIEELVNYFRYDYAPPEGAEAFACALEAATCPWQTEHRLVRIGLKGREIKRQSRPAANLVFLIDVSGSMQPENRLPLVKQSLGLLVDQLSADDTVAIAVYAGTSGCVLEPTHDRNKIRAALDRLEAGGSTNGAAGIQLAYELAQRSFKKGGTNRVILCTDGDFNVGVTSPGELVAMIQDKAKTGIFLSVFGVGMGNLKDATLEKLADKGHGNYAYIDTLAEGRKVFVEQMTGTLFAIAKDVKVQVEFNPAQVAAYRLIGYEDRLLAKEDFNDDTKDAGVMGAGHTVTALYEVVPAGKEVPGAQGVDDLKYQSPGAGKSEIRNPKSETSPEMLTVKVRYKQPDGDLSKKLEFPLTDGGATWEKSSRDFRWAASVASFGLLLRDSPHKGSANWSMTLELANEGKGDDRDGYRAEFVGLVEKAKALSR